MIMLRPPFVDELAQLSRLCMQSKAYWGYDEAFLRLCEPELSLTATDLDDDEVIVALDEDKIVGVAQVSADQDGCYLEKLFVDPQRIGQGIGRRLFELASKAARRLGSQEMIIEADPDAVPFYKSMGCTEAGVAPSGSIEGRVLPRLKFNIPS